MGEGEERVNDELNAGGAPERRVEKGRDAERRRCERRPSGEER